MKCFDPDIHHRHTLRLKEYDYSAEGLYFITVCAQDKKCLFGYMIDGEIKLNGGKIVDDELMRTPQVRPNMVIHEHVVMPNHIHFIVEIIGGRGGLNPPDDTQNGFQHGYIQSGCIQGGCNPPLRCTNTVGAMIRGFKSAVTKQLSHPIFQRNYYEHIIRNQHSYEEISDYIVSNPLRWEKDQLFVEQ